MRTDKRFTKILEKRIRQYERSQTAYERNKQPNGDKLEAVILSAILQPLRRNQCIPQAREEIEKIEVALKDKISQLRIIQQEITESFLVKQVGQARDNIDNTDKEFVETLSEQLSIEPFDLTEFENSEAERSDLARSDAQRPTIFSSPTTQNTTTSPIAAHDTQLQAYAHSEAKKMAYSYIQNRRRLHLEATKRAFDRKTKAKKHNAATQRNTSNPNGDNHPETEMDIDDNNDSGNNYDPPWHFPQAGRISQTRGRTKFRRPPSHTRSHPDNGSGNRRNRSHSRKRSHGIQISSQKSGKRSHSQNHVNNRRHHRHIVPSPTRRRSGTPNVASRRNSNAHRNRNRHNAQNGHPQQQQQQQQHQQRHHQRSTSRYRQFRNRANGKPRNGSAKSNDRLPRSRLNTR